MLFFKPKRQRALERDLKGFMRGLTTLSTATKLMTSHKLRVHQRALENDIGGLPGFMALSVDGKIKYMIPIVSQMNEARDQQNEVDFMAAYLTVMLLESISCGYHSTMNKVIGVMEKIATFRWDES
ncbi:hypothetical protein PS726_01611 [Pseudomonas fluorescens]|uniref:hypothetical protein n=1 Tax=Pseudomonas fluorescens TaxID=294 RepID=UPI000F9E86D0|nr:hypothetical protein [Pseudomonas fluorescens]VVN87713.1 hypothetical protein PS726_01611 [Pseudomonas fluorescens]